MLKRIQEQYTTASVAEMNDENYSMPTLDERENPGKPWEQVVQDRDFKNSFKGQH